MHQLQGLASDSDFGRAIFLGYGSQLWNIVGKSPRMEQQGMTDGLGSYRILATMPGWTLAPKMRSKGGARQS